jgi:hypothetical protein
MRDHGGMADDELDQLYRVTPENFTALRTELATAAKKRGDATAAKKISGARKPTTSAFIVNVLVHRDNNAKPRLTELGERLRAAHAAMDGVRIRQLSREQRALVDELATVAFKAAGVSNPSAALREDVTGTLQAAIADSDVAARLGRLTKAEQWSGFGEFGDVATVSTVGRRRATKTESPQARQKPAEEGDRAGREERDRARAALAAAERVKAQADEMLSERQSELGTARLRHEDARNRLEAAERDLAAAEDAYGEAKQASREAAELVKVAKAQLK